jgi:hypothetical protein
MYRNSFNVLAAAILSGQRQPLRVSISNRNDRNLIVTGHSYPRRPVLDTGLGFPWSAHLKLIKKCRREWKSALIKAEYPHWSDFWNLWFPGGEAEG